MVNRYQSFSSSPPQTVFNFLCHMLQKTSSTGKRRRHHGCPFSLRETKIRHMKLLSGWVLSTIQNQQFPYLSCKFLLYIWVNTTPMKRLNEGFWGEKGEARLNTTEKKGQLFFFPPYIEREFWIVPARTLGRRVQFRPECGFWSEGVSQCSGVQSPLHIHKHKCTAPQRCLSPRPQSPASWQTQARKLSIPIAFKAM